jgi:hypothetical protein
MSRFEDNLWNDLVREHGATLAQADRSKPPRARLRRPRVLVGSTLGLAAVVTALVLALGGSTAAPAFAVTKNSDGSVLVTLNNATDLNLPQLNAKLAAMGLHEGVTIYMAPGAASVTGPVNCTQGPGDDTPVEVLVGTNGTETIIPGQSTVESGAHGSYHLDRCVVTGAGDAGESGNG